MTKERVSIGHESSPLLLVAPHGYTGDDYNTDVVVKRTSSLLKCNYVINHGWKKTDVINISEEKANCNNYTHMVDEVKDEFLMPILRTVKTILKFNNYCFVGWIHGCSNKVRNIYKKPSIEMIFGDGENKNKKNRTCSLTLKDFIICNLNFNGVKCFSSFPGDQYNGSLMNNMNQLFSLSHPDPRVHSFQIEIVKELREDKTMSFLTSDYIYESLKDIENFKKWDKSSSMYSLLK